MEFQEAKSKLMKKTKDELVDLAISCNVDASLERLTSLRKSDLSSKIYHATNGNVDEVIAVQ